MVTIAVGVALAASFAAGVFPALLMSRAHPVEALKLDVTSTDIAGVRLRTIVLIAQTALAIALITSAGTFLVSLGRIGESSLGFDYARLISVTLAPSGPSDPSVIAEGLSAIRALPEVEGVTNASADPFPERQMIRVASDAPGRPKLLLSYDLVDPAFATVTGIRMTRGRMFTLGETRPGGPAVAIITEAGAMRIWGTTNVLGRCLFGFGDPSTCRHVVGVAANLLSDVAAAPVPHCLIPLQQAGRTAGGVIVVRMRHDAEAADITAIRARITSLTALSQARVTRVAQRVELQMLPLQHATVLVGVFGLLTLLATALGIYARVGYEVSLRTRELGVRTALGATPASLARLLIGGSLTTVGIGIALGGTVIALAGPFLRGFVFDAAPADWRVFAVASLTVALFSLIAGWRPARRGARLDLSEMLHSD
jgi:hypothetical protein